MWLALGGTSWEAGSATQLLSQADISYKVSASLQN